MKKLSPGLKLAYASGTITFAVKDVVFINFILFFYRQVLGVSGKMAGLALLIAMISDAFSDPIMGSFSDQFHSRWGRRHPFMALATIPLALTFVLLLIPPGGLTKFQLFLWLVVVAIALRAFLTIFFIPYLALGAELSTDYHERTSVTTYRTTMGWIVALVLYWSAMRFLFRPVDGQNGLLFAHNYKELAIFSFVTVVLFGFVCVFYTRKSIPHLPRATESMLGFGLLTVITDLRSALRNRDFRVMFIISLATYMLLGVFPSVLMHLGTFFWEFSPKLMGDVGLSMIITNLFMFTIMPVLAKRFEKHTLLKFGILFYGLNVVWFIGLRLLGVLPENGHWAITALYVLNSFFSTFFMMIIHIIPTSIIADIADEQEHRTGKSNAGVLLAVQSFSGKAVTGFGIWVGGILLDFVQMPTDAIPGEVAPEVLFKLGLATGPILGCCFLIPFLICTRLTVSRAKHAEIQSALGEQQDAESVPAPGKG
jgi:Na+/melibiose symporter-like transporter